MNAKQQPVPQNLRRHAPIRRSLCAVLVVLLAGCAPALLSPLDYGNPLVGRVWDTRSREFVTHAEAIARAVKSPIVILGEVHDNPDHHQRQASVLSALLAAGRRPALAMEQFDHEHQAGLDAALARGERDPERIADAGHFDRTGWRWPDYKPLLELAANHGLELRAANLSRADARTLMRSGRPSPGLPAASAALRATLEKDIIEGHCGHRPSVGILSGMVEAQRARDAQMAASLANPGAGGAVLIAGAGHARRNRAVPMYLPTADRIRLLSIAFVEVEAGKVDPRAYAGDLGLPASQRAFDLIWFTPRAAREDPCASLRMPS